MTGPERFINLCFELAKKGIGHVAPNPMVGCVIVRNGEPIAQGFHEAYGMAHAEVNAIASLSNEFDFEGCELYVNLEPCCHYGKTPPCVDLIIEKGIRKIGISTLDPNPLVAGRGVERLRQAGTHVNTGILEKEGKELNKRFFTFYEKKRPYVILKWAQTIDGYISHFPIPQSKTENLISCDESRKLAHQWRSEEQAIMIGTNTAVNDDPELTTRLVKGRNPIRIVIDKKGVLSSNARVFENNADVIVFTELPALKQGHIEFIQLDFGKNAVEQMLDNLYQKNVQSLMVEGGATLLNSFIQSGCWDEARVFISPQEFYSGIVAPKFNLNPTSVLNSGEDKLYLFKSNG